MPVQLSLQTAVWCLAWHLFCLHSIAKSTNFTLPMCPESQSSLAPPSTLTARRAQISTVAWPRDGCLSQTNHRAVMHTWQAVNLRGKRSSSAVLHPTISPVHHHASPSVLLPVVDSFEPGHILPQACNDLILSSSHISAWLLPSSTRYYCRVHSTTRSAIPGHRVRHSKLTFPHSASSLAPTDIFSPKHEDDPVFHSGC